MASVIAFKKRAKKTTFLSDMKSLGYTLSPYQFWFYRVRDDFIDCVALQPIGSGFAFRVHVFTTSPCLNPEYDMSNFPKDFPGGNESDHMLSPDGFKFFYDNWKSETDDELEQSLKAVVLAVNTYATPWFDQITAYRALYDSISERLKNFSEERSRFYAKLLEMD